MDPSSGWIRREALFPLKNPGIVSIPLGFLGGIVGSMLTSKKNLPDHYDKMMVQSQLAAVELDVIKLDQE
jgi:cation/acetate symporter